MAEQQFLLRSRARIQRQQPVDQPGGLQAADDGVEAPRTLGVLASTKMLTKDRVG